MVKMIAILLFATLCSSAIATDPWGSRIITQPTGQIELKFDSMVTGEPNDLLKFVVVNDKDETQEIKIDGSKCVDNADKEWSAPCSYEKPKPGQPATPGKAVITIKNVMDQKKIDVKYSTDGTMESTAFFVPDCKYDTPKTGGVILEKSVPLSRFVKGPANLALTFGVEGNADKSEVLLNKDGGELCKWIGTKLTIGMNKPECVTEVGTTKTDLLVNSDMTMRTATITVSVAADLNHFYDWSAGGTDLSVTVDGSVLGESSETASCPKVTDTTSTSAKVTETTSTSASLVVSCMVTANIGLLGALMLLGN